MIRHRRTKLRVECKLPCHGNDHAPSRSRQLSTSVRHPCKQLPQWTPRWRGVHQSYRYRKQKHNGKRKVQLNDTSVRKLSRSKGKWCLMTYSNHQVEPSSYQTQPNIRNELLKSDTTSSDSAHKKFCNVRVPSNKGSTEEIHLIRR